MPRMAWIPGDRPLDFTEAAVQDVIRLFKNETGEIYAEPSVRHLPIPVWDANLLLVDLDEAPPRVVQGVMWATPFKDDIVRVAAFVIGGQHQGQKMGSRAWDRFTGEAWAKGFRHVQLEVKADNVAAQRFYTPGINGPAGAPRLLQIWIGLHDARPSRASFGLRRTIHRGMKLKS